MRDILRRIHQGIILYMLGFTPLMAALYAWFYRDPETAPPRTGLGGFFNNLGFLWILSVVYFLLALLLYPGFRERLLVRLAGFRERDEREEWVTARASRSVFLLTLALQIVLLLLTFTTVRLVRNPDGHGVLSIGLGIHAANRDMLRGTDIALSGGEAAGAHPVHRFVLPPNMSGMLLILIAVQIAAFHVVSRRQYRGGRG